LIYKIHIPASVLLTCPWGVNNPYGERGVRNPMGVVNKVKPKRRVINLLQHTELWWSPHLP